MRDTKKFQNIRTFLYSRNNNRKTSLNNIDACHINHPVNNVKISFRKNIVPMYTKYKNNYD